MFLRRWAGVPRPSPGLKFGGPAPCPPPRIYSYVGGDHYTFSHFIPLVAQREYVVDILHQEL